MNISTGMIELANFLRDRVLGSIATPFCLFGYRMPKVLMKLGGNADVGLKVVMVDRHFPG